MYFARPNDLKEGSIGKRLQFVKPTFFFGVPRVYEKMQEKMKVRRQLCSAATFVGRLFVLQ